MSVTHPISSPGIEETYGRWTDLIARVDALKKVFVVGAAKSGTTWVQRLCDAHERVLLDGEGGFAWRTLPLLKQAIQAHNADCATHAHPEHVRYSEEEFALHFRHAVLAKLALYVERSGRDVGTLEVVGDKTPQHALGIAPLLQIFPDARFVHVVRDPRDGAVSAWHHFGKTSGRSFEEHVKWYIGASWKQSVEGVQQARTALGDRLLELRYEDLTAEPDEGARSLLRHLGVESSAEVVRSCVDASSFERLSGGRRPGDPDNNQFFRKGVVGDWVGTIDPALARETCALVAPLMASYRYEP